MPKKKNETEEVLEKIFDYTLEDIMGERFGSLLVPVQEQMKRASIQSCV